MSLDASLLSKHSGVANTETSVLLSTPNRAPSWNNTSVHPPPKVQSNPTNKQNGVNGYLDTRLIDTASTPIVPLIPSTPTVPPSFQRSTSFPLHTSQTANPIRSRPTSGSLHSVDENNSSFFNRQPLPPSSSQPMFFVPSNLPKPLLPSKAPNHAGYFPTSQSTPTLNRFAGSVVNPPCNPSAIPGNYSVTPNQTKKVRFSSSSSNLSSESAPACLLDLNMGEEEDNCNPLVGLPEQSFYPKNYFNRF